MHLVLLGLIGAFPVCAQAADNEVIFASLSQTSPTQRYYIELLQIAVEESTEEFGAVTLRNYPTPMDQSRQIQLLLEGEADVMWTMSTPERESELLAVKFPLINGLLGKRVFLIAKGSQRAFSGLSTQQLRAKVAIQGEGWPDTDILRHNDFTVSSVQWYEWQFGIAKLLLTGTVDYFPRSVIEAEAELALPHNKGLVIESQHLLDYPAFIYYFVTPSKPDLQQRLLVGLQRAEKSGRLQAHFASYPGYHSANQLLQQERTIHTLQNPFFPNQ
ncbi:hypothetical protein [Alteromonas flava]|uniref:hypothetical protein n=1 Tax=Alteromonas flava TaxID=2048003 RepID=UPI000F5D570A|nr:hypothetical protein [Alteromonas flava]